MANQIVHALKEYKVAQVGPSRDWDFKGNDGTNVSMTTYSIQLEGIADWVDLNVKAGSDAPAVGEEIKGHVEDAGKYGLKFVKEKKAGGWSGGGRAASPGAVWSSAVETATAVVVGYFQITGKKPKNIAEFLKKIEEVAPMINATVDKLAGAAAPAKEEPQKSESETGESPAPKDNGVVIDDVDDGELGDW